MKPTTDQLVRSATSDAISSACFALLEELDSELRETVMTENNELASAAIQKMINEAPEETE